MRAFVVTLALFAALLAALPASASSKEALFVAAEKGNIAAVKKHLAAGGSVDAADANKLSLLNWAAYGGAFEIVKLLVAQKADVNIHVNKSGWTPLMNASAMGHAQIAAYLLDHGADLSLLSTDGYAALSFAAAKQRTDVVKLLLAKGADRGNALVAMAYKNDAAAVRLLLENGVDPNASPQKKEMFFIPGETALYRAASDNNAPMVALLLEKGASPDVSAPSGGNMPTPLSMAAYYCNGAMIDSLLQHGASKGLTNGSGNTALDLARTGWTNNMQPCDAGIQAKLAG